MKGKFEIYLDLDLILDMFCYPCMHSFSILQLTILYSEVYCPCFILRGLIFSFIGFTYLTYIHIVEENNIGVSNMKYNLLHTLKNCAFVQYCNIELFPMVPFVVIAHTTF